MAKKNQGKAAQARKERLALKVMQAAKFSEYIFAAVRATPVLVELSDLEIREAILLATEEAVINAQRSLDKVVR